MMKLLHLLPLLIISTEWVAPTFATGESCPKNKPNDEDAYYAAQVMWLFELADGCTTDDIDEEPLKELGSILNLQLQADVPDEIKDMGLVELQKICDADKGDATVAEAEVTGDGSAAASRRDLFINNPKFKSFAWLFSLRYLRCRFCFGDNKDQRRLGVVPATGESVSEVTSIISSGLRGGGGGGRDRNLETTVVEAEAAEKSCDKCSKIDFETFGDGTGIVGTPYVSGQWKDKYGLLITSQGGYSPKGQAMIHNTRTSTTEANSPDYGSPNTGCDPSGPGQGDGGKPGAPGANCVDQGLVLVTQATADEITNGREGSTISFTFDDAVRFTSISLMDIHSTNQATIEVITQDSRKFIPVPGLGRNSVQTIEIKEDYVMQVNVIFSKYGAVTAVDFCACSGGNKGIKSYSGLGTSHLYGEEVRPYIEAQLGFQLYRAVLDLMDKEPALSCMARAKFMPNVSLKLTTKAEADACPALVDSSFGSGTSGI